MLDLIAAAVIAASPVEAPCDNRIANILIETGFTGDGLEEGWAIVMRESGGRDDAISSTGDYGWFQFNRAAWRKAEWWDDRKLLDPRYNAQVAWTVSQKGTTWYPWDIDGKGRYLGRYSSPGTYQTFRTWLSRFPDACRT